MAGSGVRRLFFFMLTLVAAVLMAGCGSSGPVSNGVASKSAAQIYNAAKAATASASSVRYSGHVQNNGKTISIDVVAAGRRGGGTITVQGAALDIVEAGSSLYLKATDAAWSKLGAPAAAAQLVADKWLQTPAANQSFGGFANFLNLSQLVGSIAAKQVPAKGKETSLNGQPAIALTDKGKGSLFVATTGKPYILEIESTQTGTSGTITFSEYNTAKPPPVPTHAININSLSGSLGG